MSFIKLANTLNRLCGNINCDKKVYGDLNDTNLYEHKVKMWSTDVVTLCYHIDLLMNDILKFSYGYKPNAVVEQPTGDKVTAYTLNQYQYSTSDKTIGDVLTQIEELNVIVIEKAHLLTRGDVSSRLKEYIWVMEDLIQYVESATRLG